MRSRGLKKHGWSTRRCGARRFARWSLKIPGGAAWACRWWQHGGTFRGSWRRRGVYVAGTIRTSPDQPGRNSHYGKPLRLVNRGQRLPARTGERTHGCRSVASAIATDQRPVANLGRSPESHRRRIRPSVAGRISERVRKASMTRSRIRVPVSLVSGRSLSIM